MIRSRDVDNRRFIFSKQQSILLIIHYFIGYTFAYPILLVKISQMVAPQHTGVHPKLFTAFILFMIVSSVWIVKEPLKRSLHFFNKNLKNNLISIIKSMAYMFGANIIINMVLIFVLKIDFKPENQEIIEHMIKTAVVPMFLSTVIFAPIVEEIIFRGVLYQNFRSKKFFYLPMLFSVLVFASMHLISGLSSGRGWIEFIFIIQYAVMALFMIRSLEDTGSLIGAIGVHALNNLIVFSVTVSGFIIFF